MGACLFCLSVYFPLCFVVPLIHFRTCALDAYIDCMMTRETISSFCKQSEISILCVSANFRSSPTCNSGAREQAKRRREKMGEQERAWACAREKGCATIRDKRRDRAREEGKERERQERGKRREREGERATEKESAAVCARECERKSVWERVEQKEPYKYDWKAEVFLSVIVHEIVGITHVNTKEFI